MTKHHARAHWSGSLPTGTGTLQLGRTGPTIPFNLTARVEEEAGTNPEQMLGAAHAGCFSMSLGNLIEETGADMSAVQVETSAVVHLESTDNGFAITAVDLTTRGTVPGMSAEQFQELAERAKNTCPVSKLFNSASITLDAELVQ
jgi:osmotically inducible protein OsmC